MSSTHYRLSTEFGRARITRVADLLAFTHALHSLPWYYKELKKYHLKHHFADFNNGFGVTSRFWDSVFGTELETLPKSTKLH